MAIINVVLGKNVKGVLDDVTGYVIISGTGAMNDWNSYDRCPLYPYRKIVKIVEIQDGVTTIGQFCFQQFVVLTHITIPNSITVIENSSFVSCSALKTFINKSKVLQIITAKIFAFDKPLALEAYGYNTNTSFKELISALNYTWNGLTEKELSKDKHNIVRINYETYKLLKKAQVLEDKYVYIIDDLYDVLENKQDK